MDNAKYKSKMTKMDRDPPETVDKLKVNYFELNIIYINIIIILNMIYFFW